MEEVEEAADLLPVLRRMPEHQRLAIDEVPVSASTTLPHHETRLDEVGQDPLGGSHGDPHGLGDVAQPDVGVARDAEEYLRVVRDELPAAAFA